MNKKLDKFKPGNNKTGKAKLKSVAAPKTSLKHRVKKLKQPIKSLKQYRDEKKGITTAVAVPYITNETVAEHREQVLKGARKYIYPLQHSKHKIVVISSTIFATLMIGLLAYSAVALYKFQDASTFIYRITQVVPFPVARIKGHFVSYENYLFELRHYKHYYVNQQKISFSSKEGKQQLDNYKQRALQDVIDNALVKQLAEKNGVSVTNRDVDEQIAIVRNQNRLGTSDEVFEDVLRDFWGWSINDFRRSLRDQILTRKVVSKLDTDAHDRAKEALAAIKNGANFADVAKTYSDDTATKDKGGDYGGAIDNSNRDIDARVTKAMFSLQPGQVSDIIDTGYSLEIVRLDKTEGDKAFASHIQIRFKDIETFLKPLRDNQKTSRYIKV